MASYAKDPRCLALADTVLPLLERSCPDGAGGFGGRFQLILSTQEAADPRP